MKIITQNPFRVLGLLGNSTERELQKQIGILKRYSEIGKTKSLDYDFEFIGDLSRNQEDLNKAASQIEQAKNKFHYSLFWFINESQFDDIALNHLREGHVDKAIQIWQKTTKGDVTRKNCTSFQNLSTLYLSLANTNNHIDFQKLSESIKLKGSLIYSNFISEFMSLVTGNGFTSNSNEICYKFIDELVEQIAPAMEKNGMPRQKLFLMFNSLPTSAQNYLKNKFIELPLSKIENKINNASVKRKKEPKKANKLGEELYQSTIVDLNELKSILGKDDLQLNRICNNLAAEILQCSIDYYNIYREEDGDFDPGGNALKIANFAELTDPTGQILERVKENKEVIKEWVDDKPNRVKYSKVRIEIKFIDEELLEFQGKSESIENANDLIYSCKQHLYSIRDQVGKGDDLYLQLSTAVAMNAQGMLISVVNERSNLLKNIDKYYQARYKNFSAIEKFALQEKMEEERKSTFDILLSEFISSVKDAWETTKLLNKLDMLPEQRTIFNKNKESLKSILGQINQSQKQMSKNGCFLATMAYGSYDHPQVLKLRKFRDDVLNYSYLGRLFIRYYYAMSPQLVKNLKNNKRINKLIKKFLDIIIEHIIS